ncbi:MAG: nucleoside 2-deoxyribosyltransferase [Anaerolineaceae bacterium]
MSTFPVPSRGGRAEEATYQAIVKQLEAGGHAVPTAHLSSPDVMLLEDVVDPVEIFERDMAWIRDCDAVVAEVSSPSHGVGYEIAYALLLGKPVLCCHKNGKRVSKIITGNTNPGLTVIRYETDAEAVNVVQEFTRALAEKQTLP